MSVTLNHTIVRCTDKHASARFLADILGLPEPTTGMTWEEHIAWAREAREVFADWRTGATYPTSSATRAPTASAPASATPTTGSPRSRRRGTRTTCSAETRTSSRRPRTPEPP